VPLRQGEPGHTGLLSGSDILGVILA